MAQREKIDVHVVGVDGSRWHISGDGAGADGVWMEDDFVGLLDTPVSTIWSSGASQIGGSLEAVRFDAREVSLPVMILDEPGRPWQQVDSRWRKAWSYTADSTIEVTSASGRRALKVRLHKTPEHKLEKGGQFRGASRAFMSLKAGDPLWYSSTQTDVWRFDGTHYAGEVEVSNPTDMPMWLAWTITGPASMILPDFSWETREGWPGYEHQDRRVVLPHQGVGVDVVVDTNPEVEQVTAMGRPGWWQLMNGQFFCYPVPPWTPPTKLPVVVNPIPLLPSLWHRLSIPGEIPAAALVAMAAQLEELLAPLGPDTVLSWTPQRLAQEIDAAIRAVLPDFVGEWTDKILEVLTIPTIGEVIAETWGSVANMAGAGVQARQVRAWSRPYGLE